MSFIFKFFSSSFWSALGWLGLYNKKARIVFLGLDNAGKTTLLHALKDDKVLVHEPTQHAQCEELVIDSVRFKAFDLGGHLAARRLWKDYFVDVQGIVFMVDVTDTKRLPEAKQELDKLLTTDELRKVPFLILGNKIDAKGAVGEKVLKSELGLDQLTTDEKSTSSSTSSSSSTTSSSSTKESGVQPIKVQMCSVAKRCGIAEGFNWLSSYV
eukprot:TRINITY_DN1015_c0_g1_i1.p1 TRINITY_DN1015_c0_g1~~TRINITY_DN1015_c0_g1_i1.p1  ORF type:complete len:212 (-),score=84.59 TRINITY_DN1015_c0_g1_i1:128-763(-)